MAYQPMYATISDNVGYVRSTSSRRGKVSSVSCWINSLFGSVLKTSARFIECPIPDLRGIPKERREAVIKECKERERVVINIDVETNKNFILNINGLEIPMEHLKALQEWNMDKFNLQIERLTDLRDTGKTSQMLELVKVMVN